MLRLSIIVPVLESVDQFEATLASVLQNRPAGCEVLVVHPFSYEDPYELASEVRFLEATAATTRSQLIEVGLRAARAEIVHLIQCGLEVEDGWADAALPHFRDPLCGSVAPLVLTADRQRVVSAGMSYRPGGARQVHCRGVSTARVALPQGISGPLLAAAFYRKRAILDGARLDLGAGDDWIDVELALQAQQQGFSACLEPGCQVRATSPHQPPRGTVAAGRQVERLFWRHWHKDRRVAALARHAGVVAKDLLRPGGCASLVGRAMACVDWLLPHYSPRLDTDKTASVPLRPRIPAAPESRRPAA